MTETKNHADPLLTRLEAAEFTGRLELRFEKGSIVGAELHHLLANSEFEGNPLPGIEGKPKAEFTLTAE